MPKLVIRHAISEANNRDNIGTMAFGAKDAPLMEELALPQMRKCAHELRTKYKLNPAHVEAATSELLRTQQTAEGIGFKIRKPPYALLNEVEHGIEGSVLKQMLKDKQLPSAALAAARAILADPPSEKVLVTHGLVIAGLCHILEIQHEFEYFIPKFCEIRVLPI